MNLPLFIARKIYGDEGDRRKVSRPAIRIATIGVAIGLAVMIITVSVVLGFKHTIRDKVIGFGSHIQVINLMSANNAASYPVSISDSMMQALSDIEGISHVQRYALTQGILKTDDEFLGVIFKGVGPEFDPSFLQQNLKEGEIPKFSDTKSGQKILLSRMIADKLGLKSGDRVFSYFIDSDDVRVRRFTVSKSVLLTSIPLQSSTAGSRASTLVPNCSQTTLTDWKQRHRTLCRLSNTVRTSTTAPIPLKLSTMLIRRCSPGLSCLMSTSGLS